MKFYRTRNFIIVLFAISPVIIGASFVLPGSYQKVIYDDSKNSIVRQPAAVLAAEVEPLGVQKIETTSPEPLANPPSVIKAVYITSQSASQSNYLDYLSSLFKTTEINAVVVDIKDFSGNVSYNTNSEIVKKYQTYKTEIKDINKFVQWLHDQNIYVIGRIVVFYDPALVKARPDLAIFDKTKTKDLTNPVLWQGSGSYWLDPASQDVWNYNISIAQDALTHGFDEINFDYVRFPSDGNVQNMGFPIWNQKTPKRLIIKNFFQKLRESLPGAKISVDLFGQTTVNKDDLGIGQYIEDSFDYFDYICPMVYPSHYKAGFMGFDNPADHPYEVIKHSIDTAVLREAISNKLKMENVLSASNNNISEVPATPSASNLPFDSENPKTNVPGINMIKIRPWLQDFNLGANYNAEMIKQEIKATIDATGESFNGYLLWNQSNTYTKNALLLTTNPEPK